MAVPSFTAASTGSTDAGGAWTATCHAPAAAGRVIILHVLQDGTADGTVSVTSITNAENLAGTDNVLTPIGAFDVGGAQEAIQHLWIGRSLSTTAPVATGANSGTDDVYWRFYEFANVAAGTTLATVIENVTAGATVNSAGTSDTLADASVTTIGPDRLCLNLVAGNDDNALGAFAGETGGNWVEAVEEFALSTGTDGVLGLQTAAPDASILQETAGTFRLLGNLAATMNRAQSFTTSGAIRTTSVAILLDANTGSPADGLIVEIRTDNAGVPSSTVLGSEVIASPTPTAWNSVPLSVFLAPATKYWVNVRRTGALDESNYHAWQSATSDVLAGEANYSARTSFVPALYTTSGAFPERIYGSGGTSEQKGQSFKPTASATIVEVRMKCGVVGTPTDNFIVEIQTDASGVPSGTVVGTGATVAASSIVNGVLNNFAVTASLTADTTYWIVGRRSGARDVTKAIEWRGDLSGTYADGNLAAMINGTWSALSGQDTGFEVIGAGPPTWTLVSSFDQAFRIIAPNDAGVINGGTMTWADATDAWGVVGFALIGTTTTDSPKPRSTIYPQLLPH